MPKTLPTVANAEFVRHLERPSQPAPVSTAPDPKDPNEILRPRGVKAEFKVDWKTVKRARPHKVLDLGKRAKGIRRGDVLGP